MKTRINLFLVNALIVTLVICFSTALFFARIRSEALHLAKVEQEEALKTFWQLLRAKGSDFRIADGRLMAGDYVINGNHDIPDKIREIFGGTATIFMGDMGVSTNVLSADDSRAVGTKLTGPVYDAIFKNNRQYRGETPILGIPCFTACDPIRDKSGRTIGALCVGEKKSDHLAAFNHLKWDMIVGTTAIGALFIAIAFVLLGERSRHEKLFRESEQKYRQLFQKMLNGFALFQIIHDRHGSFADLRYIEVNDAHALHTGLARGQVLGKTLRELFPGGDDAWLRLIRELAGPESPRQVEIFFSPLAKWFEIAVYAPNEGQLALVFSDISRRREADAKIQQVARVLSETTGETFFSSLVENLAQLLQAEYAFIGELAGDKPDTVRVIASFAHGKPAETFEYSLPGTPCAEVIKGSLCFYHEGVSRRFPGNRLLNEMNAEGFLGMPIRLADGRIVGVLAVLDSKPLRRRHDTESIFQLFAVRAAAELNRRKNEDRLREMADQLRLVTDSVPVCIAYVDASLHYRFVNSRYEEWFKLEREKIVGRSIEEMLGTAAFGRIQPHVEAALAGKEVTFINEMAQKDGSTVFLQATYVPHRLDNHEVIGFFALVTDITANKELQEALRNQLGFLQTLIDTIPNPIFYKDREGRYLGCNQAFESHLGQTKEQLVGKTVYDMAPKDLADRYFEMDEALFINPGVQVYESSVLYADGIRHDVIFNKATFTDKGDAVAGLVGVILDVTERKKAEDMLAEREEFLSNILDSIQDGISIIDEDLRIIRVNPVIERRFSDRMPIVGRKCHEGYHGLREPCESCPTLETLRNGKPSFKIFPRMENETELWLELHTFPLFDSKKSRITGVIEYTRDVTERKRAEEALAAAEKKYRSLVEQSLVGTYIIRDGKFTYVNPKLAEIFGYTQEEITSGMTPLDLTVADDRARVIENIRKRSAGEVQSIHYLFQGLRKDGAAIHAEVYGTRIESGGKPLIIGTLLDVTERKRTEAALRESEERFHQVFAQNGDAIVLFRLDSFAIIDANQAAEELTGFSREELQELAPVSFIDPADFSRLITAMPTDDCSRAFQLDKATGTRKDGRAVCVAIRAKILRLRDEYVIHCSVRDITEKVRLEEEIRATQAKLIHTNKMTSLGMLASSIAHEINNPNNYIAVNATMLADAWRDAAPVLRRHRKEHGDFPVGGLSSSEMEELAPRLFTGIAEGSRRINAIITNMKDYVRTDDPSLVAEFDMNKTVQDAAAILWHHIQRHTDNFRLALADDLPPARGNRQQIEQVVINLIMNALQALPDKKSAVSATTTCDREAGVVTVTVRDEGTGMGEKVLEHLTEPFFSTKIDQGGTGLGLYISASIIKEHKGLLEFDSKPGSGTTVTVRLPAA